MVHLDKSHVSIQVKSNPSSTPLPSLTESLILESPTAPTTCSLIDRTEVRVDTVEVSAGSLREFPVDGAVRHVGVVLVVEVLLKLSSDFISNDHLYRLVVDPDSVEAGVEDVRPSESVSPHQGRHLPLRVVELRGKEGHQLVIVEEAGGIVEESVRVGGCVTVLKLLPIVRSPDTLNSPLCPTGTPPPGRGRCRSPRTLRYSSRWSAPRPRCRGVPTCPPGR